MRLIEVQEYKLLSKTKVREKYSELQWKELCLYTSFLSGWAKERGIEDIPEIKGDNLEFKSFIGKYHLENSEKPLCIKVNNNKLPENDYQKILTETNEWCNLLGPTIISQLHLITPLDKEDKILSYSNQLVELTDLSQNTFLTPLIENPIVTGQTVFGRIDLVRTSRLLTQGQTQIVSIKTKVITETLPLLLLLRFNIEVSKALQDFINKIRDPKSDENEVRISIERIARKNLLYHMDFVFNPRFNQLINRALDTDFFDPDILDQTSRQSKGNPVFQDVILLWEGYSSGKVLLSSLFDTLLGGYALKPMSKIYELWLLKTLDSIIKIKYGTPVVKIHPKGSMTFKYLRNGKNIILNYNISIPRKWKRFEPKSVSMRPDFVIAIKQGRETVPVLIADAKYKETPKNSDKQQMMAYILATGWGGSVVYMVGSILYIGTKEVRATTRLVRKEPNAEIKLINVRPNSSLDELESLVYSVI